jgi:hypothetical protein
VSAIRALRLVEALGSAVVSRYAASSCLDVSYLRVIGLGGVLKSVLWVAGRGGGGSPVTMSPIISIGDLIVDFVCLVTLYDVCDLVRRKDGECLRAYDNHYGERHCRFKNLEELNFSPNLDFIILSQ